MVPPQNVYSNASAVKGAWIHPLKIAAIPIIIKLTGIKWVQKK